MNVTRNVVTDLLPVYFAGEASGDTKVLVEDYFRQDPDFERIARSAATPLETLRDTATLRPDAEREKHDLENIRCGLQRRKWLFAVALSFTFAPLAFVFKNGHIAWMMVRDAPWDAAFYWIFATLFWFYYLARLSRRTGSLVFAIFLTLLPLRYALHHFFPSAPGLTNNIGEVAVLWITAAILWFQYFRLRRR